MKRLLTLNLLLLALLAGTAEAARLSRDVMPENYKLILTPRMELKHFLGDEVITVRVSQPVREITLHAADLDIERVHVRDRERKQRAQFELDPDSSTMTIRVRKELIPGEAEIHISYRGPLRDDLRGLYLSRSARDTYLFTQLQPVDARRVYPCFDEPDLKATFDVSVIVESEHLAISNTKIISSLPGPIRGTRRIRFDKTPPMSTYMFALAIGPFDCLNGKNGDVPVRFCAQQDYAWKGRATLSGTIDLLEFYEGWFKIPYPFQKLDVVALPDMAAGGMENPGALFLRESWAMVDDKASVEARRWSTTMLAHELSHMWVGDHVTMEWWRDLWLNEGLATWMATKALGELNPEVGTEQVQTFRRLRTFGEDALSTRGAVAGPVEDETSLFELFDIVTNEKPAAMMAMLERVTGEDALQGAIRDYLIRYSWGNASTADFVQHIESELGGDAASIVRDYVSRPGFPVVEVSSTCEGGSGRVTFSQQSSDGGAWHVPVCVRQLSDSPSATEMCFVLDEPKTIDLDAGCNVPLLVNPGVPGYYRVLYSRDDLGKIVEMASSLSVTEKLNLLDNEWWLVTEGRHSIGDYLALLERGFSRERDASVVVMIVSRLGTIDRRYVSAEVRGEFTQWMQTYFASQLRLMGPVPPAGETAERGRLRQELLWAAGALGHDPAAAEMAQRYVRKLLSDPESVDRSMADTMIHLAARTGDDALYNVYLSRVRRARNDQEGYRFLIGLTSFTSPDLVRRTLELTMTDLVRGQDATAVVSKLLSNPDSAESAWSYIRENWGEFERRLPVTFTSDRIVHAAGSFCSSERRKEVAEFFRSKALAPKTLDASLERIDQCVATRASRVAAFDAWLSEWGRLASAGSTNP